MYNFLQDDKARLVTVGPMEEGREVRVQVGGEEFPARVEKVGEAMVLVHYSGWNSRLDHLH